MNPQIVTVNLIPGLSTPAVVRVSQYDVERPITFRVLDGNKAAVFPDDCTATIEATKPSGLGFSLLGTIAPGGIVNFTTAMSVTQECGMFPAEIRFSTSAYGSFPATDIGTANFILAIEPSPHPEGTTDGTQETMQNLETRLQSEINDLSDRIDDIEAGGSGLSQTEKNLILTLFSKAAYAEDDAGDAYDALEALWTTTTRTITYNLSHVSSSNTTASIESGQSYTTTLTVSTDYTLNSVTVTMGGVDITSTSYSSGTVSIPSVTGNIVITATAVLAAQSITAVYTQSGTVYDTDTLDSLKADLVVTVNYSGGTSETVPASNYTLSGTLTEGTSTITVNYAGLTTTFNVTVSEYVDPRTIIYNWDLTQSLTDTVGSQTITLNDGATQSSSGLTLGPGGAALICRVYNSGMLKNRDYEFDIASMTKNYSGHNAELIAFGNTSITASADQGFTYRTSGVWQTNMGGSWSSESVETSATAFSGKTLRMHIDNDGIATFYDGETLLATAKGILGTTRQYMRVGDPTYSVETTVITGIRVYSTV